MLSEFQQVTFLVSEPGGSSELPMFVLLRPLAPPHPTPRWFGKKSVFSFSLSFFSPLYLAC